MADQGSEYATFIENELKHEYDRRDAVNSRAAGAITAATGLVTIVLAVLAVLKGKDFTLTGGPLTALAVALIALLVAAVLAILAGINPSHEVTTVDTMRKMLRDHWGDSEVDARNLVAGSNIQTIDSLRKGTNVKFRYLTGGAVVQVVAVLALSVSALLVIA